MKVKFHKVIIDNFLSFGHAEVTLENCGYTLVEGINHNPKDGAKSNGSGKSSIFNAICYALTGETINGLSNNLNNIITKGDMGVELEFSVDDDFYDIKRTRDIKGHANLKIFINGEDKSGKGVRESEEVLKQFLPDINSDLIGEVIIVGQGMPHKFSNNTPSGRKELLEKLSHSDFMLEDIKNRVDSRFAELSKKLNDLEIDKSKEEAIKSYTETSLVKKENELETFNVKVDFDENIDTLNKEITQLNEQLTSTELNQTFLKNRLDEINNQLIDLAGKKQKALAEETKTFNEHNLSVKTLISEKQNSKKLLLEEITKLKNIKDVCPLCGQKLPHVHKQDTSELENKVKTLDDELLELNNKDSQQETAYKLNLGLIKDDFKGKENSLTQNKLDTSFKLNEMDVKANGLNTALKDKKIALAKVMADKDNFEANKAKCIKEIEELKNALTSINDRLLYIINVREDITKHQEIVAKMVTLVKRDFRGILLSSIIGYINQKCKSYAKDIFGTDELEFALDGNNIAITYSNKPLEVLSGGEQQKVDLILQFAIRSMMQEYTGFSSNIIVLDEILDNLDSVGCDSVLNFITNRLSDIESIFIISHHADSLNIGNDSTITVMKGPDGVSSIV